MKRKVLFVGSFKNVASDGSVGGQMFACKTIMESELADHFDWILLDTTALSNIKSSFIIRLIMAIKRIFIFIYYTLFCKIDKYLIFVGDGWSFWEKGLMILIVKFFTNAEAILAPRSGFIENDIQKNVLRKFISYVFIKADKIICQSEKWRILFSNLIHSSNDKFIIIENGISLVPYIDFPISRNRYQDNTITILFLSWVDKNKGIFELLEAVLLLKNNNIRFKLIVAGNGAEFLDARNFVINNNLNGDVDFVGWVYKEKKYELLANADIFILPTHFEGYPNSLLEAMSSGKACIVTSVGSIPDMIENKTTGLLIEKENSNEVYNSLKCLITDDELRMRLSIAARNIVINRNSKETFVSKFNDLLIT